MAGQRECAGPGADVTLPQTRYASLGGADIAYQVLGEGPLDLVYANGLTEHIDVQWEHPLMARFLERLASFSRLIMFDRRGAGASDPVPLDALPTWEEWADDLRVVLDAAGSERAAIYAELDAGAVGMIFAATHPERTSVAILWRATPRLRTTRTGPPRRRWRGSSIFSGPPGERRS
jgi:pimeloyl-ACP methyl ester carboxylesterase